jgi:hypothetical protein
MTFLLGFAIGAYLGIGGGYALWTLAEVGLGRGWSLTWRIAALICFWPGLFLAAIAR